MNKYKMTDKVKALIQGTDSARKRDFTLSLTTHPINTASYWSGGSKECFTVINIITGRHFTPPMGTFPEFDAHHTLQPGEVMMETGIFIGKPACPHFYCLPEDNNRVRNFLGLALELSGNMVTVDIERETEVLTVDTGATVLA